MACMFVCYINKKMKFIRLYLDYACTANAFRNNFVCLSEYTE